MVKKEKVDKKHKVCQRCLIKVSIYNEDGFCINCRIKNFDDKHRQNITLREFIS